MTTESNRVIGPLIPGRLLVPLPGMGGTDHARSVILVCTHTAEEGAVGLVLNRPKSDKLDFRTVCEHVSVDLTGVQADARLSGIIVAEGGPHEETCGFVLHSADWHQQDGTIRIDERLSLTSATEIIHAIAHDNGPRSAMIAFGHTLWQPGELERALSAPGWFVCPVHDDLVYDADHDSKYLRALARIGVDPACLVNYHGNA